MIAGQAIAAVGGDQAGVLAANHADAAPNTSGRQEFLENLNNEFI